MLYAIVAEALPVVNHKIKIGNYIFIVLIKNISYTCIKEYTYKREKTDYKLNDMSILPFGEIGSMLTIVVAAMVIVLMAMAIDLASGLYKAKLRGEIRSSWGLKRTLTKFITYEGGMIIAAGVDMLMHMSQLVHLFGLETISGVPVITCLVGVFLLVVEFISIREKADKKTQKEMAEAANLLAQMLTNDNFKEVIRVAMEQQEKKREGDAA